MSTLSPATEKIVEKIGSFASAKFEPGSKIHVDYIASKVASFYERIRNVLEYQEEHLFRKKAIDRMLRRRLLMQENNKRNIAAPLIAELIRAGYLPNDAILESVIVEVQIIINKYIFLLNYISDLGLDMAKQEDMAKWLISLASCEIEEKLAPPLKDNALADYMYETINPRIVLRNASLHEEERKAQIFIAIQKVLLRADDALINYRLLKLHFPQWTDSTNKNFLDVIASRLVPLKDAIEAEIRHPLGQKFFKTCNQYNTPYLVIGDALVRNPDLLTKSPEEIENGIDLSYQDRFKNLKKKLKRAAIYVTVSIFVTKVLIALAIEIPFDLWVTKELVYTTLAINILFPPFLMFLIVSTIKPPRSENAQKVILEAMKIIYQSAKQDEYEIKPSARRSAIIRSFIDLFYFIIFIAVFALIVWGLLKIKFSWPSIAIFLIFVSLICFAGLKIRQRSKELDIEKTKESGLAFLIDLFALPLVQVGKWLSGQWSRFNIFVVFFNLILEVPLLTFVEFLENWRHFMKEKKEEIQ